MRKLLFLIIVCAVALCLIASGCVAKTPPSEYAAASEGNVEAEPIEPAESVTSRPDEQIKEEVKEPSEPTTDITDFQQPLYNYCYSHITTVQQGYYELLKREIERYNTEKIFVCEANEENPQRDMEIAAAAVINDNPQIFWCNDFEITLNTDNDSYYLSLNFLSTDLAETQNRLAALNFKTEEIARLTDGMTYGEAMKFVFDYVKENVVVLGREENYTHNTAYSAIINKKATAEGVTRAVQLILRHSGINCTVAKGKIKNGHNLHFWNIAELKGNWLHIDVTKGIFGVKDNEIASTHSAAPDYTKTADEYFNISLPICN